MHHRPVNTPVVRGSRKWIGAFWCALIAPALAPLALSSHVSEHVVFEIVASFDPSGIGGRWPFAPLLQASDGTFYGTTRSGGAFGAFGDGTIFRMDASGTLTTLHSFNRDRGDGAAPEGPLIEASDGFFYGTTGQGGAFRRGTIFRMDPSGAVTTLHSFSGNDGAGPMGGVIEARDGSFYGTTHSSGQWGGGTIFRLAPEGTPWTFTTLHHFPGPDGRNPFAGLIQAKDGSFWGTATSGGLGDEVGYGTVFRLEADGTLRTIHYFRGFDGAQPTGQLIQASDGLIYGTTFRASSIFDPGTIFAIAPEGPLVSLWFPGQEGAGPLYAGLIQARDGHFYGTGGGLIFRFEPRIARTTVLHRLDPAEGSSLYAPLIQAADGSFYGTARTNAEGDICCAGPGTIFRLRLTRANHTPVVLDDAYGLDANTSLTVPAPGVLSNDTDEDGDALSATPESAPAHGTVALNSDGSFTYTPMTDYTGLDSFLYAARDGSAMSQLATVSLTVTAPVVPAPVITVEPDALLFGPQRVGEPSARQRVIVRNTGTAPLVVKHVRIGGAHRWDFAQTNTCARPIATGERCVIRVTFTPLKMGARRAAVVVAHNAATEPIRIRLMGEGQRRSPRLARSAVPQW
jgi:uncharacterized repeat protein (TIGR03803 family)